MKYLDCYNKALKIVDKKGDLSEKERSNITDRLTQKILSLQSDSTTNTDEILQRVISEMKKEVHFDMQIKSIQVLNDRRAVQSMIDAVDSISKDDSINPFKALLQHISPISRLGKNEGLDASSVQIATEKKYTSLVTKLQDEIIKKYPNNKYRIKTPKDLSKMINRSMSKSNDTLATQFDKVLFDELIRLDSKKPALSAHNDPFIEDFAQGLLDILNYANKRNVRYGVEIDKFENRGFTQSYDDDILIRMGVDSTLRGRFKSFDKRIKIGKNKFSRDYFDFVDWDKTQAGMGKVLTDKEKHLLLSNTYEKALKGSDNKFINERVTNGKSSGQKKRRVIHFKEENRYEVYRKLSKGGAFNSIIKELRKSAHIYGASGQLGTNPAENIKNVIKDIKKSKTTQPTNSELNNIQNMLDVITGEARVPHNALWARRNNAARTWVGSTVAATFPLSAVSIDPVLMNHEFKKHGMLISDRYITGLQSISKSMEPSERRAMMEALDMHFAVELGENFNRHNAIDNVNTSKLTHLISEKTHRLTGLSQITEYFDFTTAFVFSKFYGGMSKKPFSSLSDDTSSMLTNFGIDAKKWDILRHNAVNDGMLTLEGVRGISNSTISKHYPKMKEIQVAQFRDDLETSLSTMFSTRINHAVIKPDANTSAIIGRGFFNGGALHKDGSFWGEVFKYIGHLKAHPITFYSKILKGEIYNSTGMERIKILSLLATQLTIAGYVRLLLGEVDDVLFGKQKEFSRFDNYETLLKSINYGGVTAVAPDLANFIGRGDITNTAIVFDRVWDASKLITKKDKSIGDLIDLSAKMTPLDTIYFRILLDEFWDNIKEASDPVRFSRDERRERKRYQRQLKQREGSKFIQ